jgi:nicotinamidase-related amidase
MGLKFLERDERVAYIAETWEQYKKIGVPPAPELYKKGQRPAVLAIDLQYAFTSPDSPLGPKDVSEEMREIIDRHVENSKRVIDAARKKGIHIFYCALGYREDGTDGGPFVEKIPILAQVCREGTRMTDIDERVKPHKGDHVMIKKESSFFAGTPLAKILTYLMVVVNILLGNSASGCVRATAVDSLAHGFYPVVPEECIADRAIGPLKSGLFDMMSKYVDMVSVEDVLNWIATLPVAGRR